MNTRSLQGVLRILLALVFSISLAGLSAQEARADTFNVTTLDDSGAGSLREAITSANASGGTDWISITISGTITLASALPAISESVTITGSGQDITISGANSYRVLSINNGAFVHLTHLTIANGFISGSNGGGIYNAGHLVLDYSTLSGNQATYVGGAIYNHYGTVIVTGSTFINNSLSALSGSGAAIYTNHGSVSAVNSTFTNNVADSGGAITTYYGILEVLNSTFSVNTAATHGGGIYSTNGTLYLENSILANSIGPDDCYSDVPLAADVNNLIEFNSGCGVLAISADPKLAPLADNGGSTRTFALMPGSPAFDAGDDAICALPSVNNLDQRGVSRPHGAHCDIGSYEMDKATLTFRSTGARDGWILESGENTTAGGTLDSTATIFRLGDNAQDKQYRAILSFNTSALPEYAVITRVMLKIRYQGLVGTDPFTILGGLKVDVRKPYFGPTLGLVVGDFQAAAGLANAATFRTTPVNNWYVAVLKATGYPHINLAGTTQFRLRFLTGDNDDLGADYMKFYSGNNTNTLIRPALVVTYNIP